MDHRIKAPCNKNFVSEKGGGTGKSTLNFKKNIVARKENNNPFTQPGYSVETTQHPVTKENYVTVHKKDK